MIWGSGVGYLTSRHSSVCGSPEARKLAKNELGVWGGVLYQWLLQHVCGSPRGGGGEGWRSIWCGGNNSLKRGRLSYIIIYNMRLNRWLLW